MDTIQQLANMDAAMLAPIVNRMLASESAELLAWECRPHEHAGRGGNITTGGVYRVKGTALDGGAVRSWSLICKLLTSPAGMVVPGGTVISDELAEDAARFSYWRREANAFASGRLDALHGPLVAPRCYGITELSGRQIWLWLEDLQDQSVAAAKPDYELLGRHLGRFNGGSAGYRPGAGDEWISRGWLRSWLETAIAGYVPVLENAELWNHPMLRLAFREPVQPRLLRLWTERETLLGLLEQLPQAFCHLDAYPANLFTRDGAEPRTVAIDWSFAGMASLGEELAPLVIATALTGMGDVAAIVEAEQRALEGYLAGLREAGWRGGASEVRLAYRASAALRYAFLGPEPPLRALLEPEYQAETVRRMGRPWEHIVEQRAALTYLLLDYAEQALEQVVGV